MARDESIKHLNAVARHPKPRWDKAYGIIDMLTNPAFSEYTGKARIDYYSLFLSTAVFLYPLLKN